MFTKLKTLSAALLVMSIVALTGCSFNNLGGTIEGAYGDVLTVFVDTDCTDQGMDRKIVPANWEKDTEVSDMKLVLSGSSRNGQQLPATVLVKDAEGKFPINLTYDVWALKLQAFTTYEGVETEVLHADTVVDLKNGGSSIEFALTTEGLEGNGGIAVSGTYTDASDAARLIVVGILDYATGSPVRTSDGIAKAVASTKDFTYTVKDLPAGEYVLSVQFKNADTNGEVIGYWTEAIRVVPGKITDATIDCGALKTEPLPPENLKVLNEGTPDKSTGKYKVKLSWEDKSNNEDGFRIYVYEYTAWGTKPTDPTKILSEKTDAAKNFVRYTDDPMYNDGNLLAGSKTLTLTLDTGKIYDFDIVSYNIVKDSTVCERVESTDYKAPATENIAQTKITYNLNNGTLVLDGTTYIGNKYIEIKQYKGADIDLLDISGTTTLKKGLYDFSNWSVESKSTSTKVEHTTGVANCTVYAQYLTQNFVDFTVDPIDNKLTAEKVSVKVGDTSVVNGEVLVTPSTVVNFEVTPDLGDGIVCDVFEIRVNNNTIYEGTSATFAWDDACSLESGTYSVEVYAKPSGSTHWHGFHFLLTIGR